MVASHSPGEGTKVLQWAGNRESVLLLHGNNSLHLCGSEVHNQSGRHHQQRVHELVGDE